MRKNICSLPSNGRQRKRIGKSSFPIEFSCPLIISVHVKQETIQNPIDYSSPTTV
jgi:hypothetical protein